MADLNAAALAFIAALETTSGVPIAVLDRIADPQMFWARSAAILCQKTGDSFCDDDVRFMTANTEPSGMSRIIEYRVGDGPVKRVCALLPPMENIDPWYVGDAFGTPYLGPEQYPTSVSTAAWLTLYHATHCLDTEFNEREEDRALAVATLGLTLLQGDPSFLPGRNRAQSRRLAVITGSDAAYYAAGTGERVLLNHWKSETAAILRRSYRCNAAVERASTINIEGIRRDRRLEADEDCISETQNGQVRAASGTVSDENLWIWLYGEGGMGAPPSTYEPMEPFSTMSEGVDYVLGAAEQIVR